ncbi:hypothetical protein MMC11_002399 [Xylographa trunciseda]|nr:hypothetical protein [Xylographa trunciseda]
MAENPSCPRPSLDHDEDRLDSQQAQQGESIPSQQQNMIPASTSIAVHDTFSKDQTAGVEAADLQRPTLLSEKLQAEQRQNTSNCLLTRATSSGDNVASSSKHDHMYGPQFSRDQMMQNDPGISQERPSTLYMNMANPAQNLLLSNGISPSLLTPAQLECFQQSPPHVQERSLRAYAQNMMLQQQRQGMTQLGRLNQGYPMPPMPLGTDGGMHDPYNANTTYQMCRDAQVNHPHNHALQDYQMQLMLLEQQNKQRLLMARQEQENLWRDAEVMPGQSVNTSQTRPGVCATTEPSHTQQHASSDADRVKSKL